MTMPPPRTTPERSRRRGRARFWRHLIVRVVAVLTCLLALAGVAVSIYAYRQVDTAEQTAQRELGQISEQFALVSATLLTVNTSAANAAASVDQAGLALTDSAKTTRDFAAVLDQTASVINFTIPGLNLRPLNGLDTNFRDQARQLRDLATQVDQTNTALGQNSQDLRAISADVTRISGQMGDISTQLRRFSTGPDSTLTTITDGTRMLTI